METAAASPVQIHQVDPLAHADALKALFASHERPDFASYFDRAYPDAVRDGGCSWVGLGAGGSVVMHIARFTQRFRVGGRTAGGGLLVNLMTARSQRSFFPSLALLRRAIADSRAAGDIDFLYGDPNEKARRLMQRAGMAPVGELERYVLPLRDERWYADAAVRAYHVGFRARYWPRRVSMTQCAAAQFDSRGFEDPSITGDAIRPLRPPSLFRRRLEDYPGAADHWFVVQTKGLRAAAAVRGLPDGTALLCALQRSGDAPLTAIVSPLARALRRAGHHRLWLWTLAHTRFAAELRHAGFIPRHERLPVLGIAFTELGERVLNASAAWETTHLDFDR